mgnify:CR=1 FL=1
MIKKINLHRKPPRWFREQKERKKRSFGGFFKAWLWLLFLIIITLVGLRVWFWMRQGLWDGRHNFNFVIWSQNQFYVIAYRSGMDEINILQVSPETYLPLVKGYGEYRASSVWQLGELEKFGGGQLLQLSTQNFLGVPMQGWGKINSKFNPPAGGSKLTKRELLIMIGRLIFTKEKNLTAWDLIRFLDKINSLPASKINYYNLDETRAGEEIELPDGQRAFKIEQAFLDNLVKNLYKDIGVLNEGIIWVVINKNQHAGLATQIARMIDNIGGEVTAFYEKPEMASEGIYCGLARQLTAGLAGGQSELCESYTVALLSRTLKLPIKRETFQESRAEAVIVLGENHWQFFYQR